MEQLGLDLEATTPPAVAKRRIDITLERLEEEFNALPDDVRTDLIGKPWVTTLEMIGRLRGMEMAEEEVRPCPDGRGLANTFDRLVSPGESAVEALLRTFAAVYGAAPLPRSP